MLALNAFSDQQTIVDVLRNRAYHQPDQLAYKFLEHSDTQADKLLTYGSLELNVRSLAAFLQDHFPPGTRALLLYDPGLDFVIALFACFYAGLLAVPALPPRQSRPSPLLLSIVCDASPGAVLTTRELLPAVTKFLGTSQMGSAPAVLTTNDLALQESHVRDSSVVSADSLAILQYTSGSTSDPKGVMITHANIAANAANMEELFTLNTDSVGVSWLPSYHDMGLIGSILQPLYTGFPGYLMSPLAFLWKPLRWLEAVSKYRATVSGGPNFAFAVCTKKISDAELESLDLSSWTTAYVGAEPIQAQTLAGFADKFAACGFDRKSFCPCYGLAEATLVVSAALPGHGVTEVTLQTQSYQEGRAVLEESGVPGGITVVSCCKPAAGVTVKIVDPQTCEPCIDQTIGEILIAGASVTAGYWNKESEHSRFFVSRIHDDVRTFFKTGDLGFFYDDQLYISGRLKDTIIIHGRNHYANDIEFTVERSLSGLRVGASAAFAISEKSAEQLVVVQEVDRSTGEALLKEAALTISRALAETHELTLQKLAFVRVGAIPRTSSGKIRRDLCRTLYQTDKLELLS